VQGITNADSVACGEAHVLCVTSEGQLFAWGQNSCGQLGVGCTVSGFLMNHSSPVAVRPFAIGSHDSSSPSPFVPVASVCCGSYHSIAVDRSGECWSWGGRGSHSLGHFDAGIQGSWANRINTVFATGASTAKVICGEHRNLNCLSSQKPQHPKKHPY